MKLSISSLLPPRDLGWNRVRATCRRSDCRSRLLTRHVPGSRVGLFVGDHWYCSPDCFAMGMHHALDALASPSVVEMPRNPRLSLGLALVARGFVTEEQYRSALIACERRGEILETVLLEAGWITEKQLAISRAFQWGYPALPQELAVSPVQADLPVSLLRAIRAVPIHYTHAAKRLVLGFVDFVDHSLLQAVEHITGCRSEPCFITPAEFAEQIARLSRTPDYQDMLIDNLHTPIQMGRALGGWALEVSGREARITRCRSYIWARVAGKRSTVDVIFDLKNISTTNWTEFSTRIAESSVSLG